MKFELASGALLMLREPESPLEELELPMGELELVDERLAISLTMEGFSLRRRRKCKNAKRMKNRGRYFPF